MSINDFLKNYYNNLVKKDLNKVVVAPKAMIIKNTEDEDGWFEWRPANANTTTDDINKLESKYNLNISKQYIEYLLASQFMDIQLGEYILYGVNELNTLEKIITFSPTNILSFGFFPIGSINDTDFLALNKEGQVVRLSYDDYALVEILFDDFNSFIESLLLYI